MIVKLIEEKVKFRKVLEDEKDTNNELLNETERLNALLSRLRDYYENRLNRRFER
jgi:DNA-binding IscR family transcriptional regulator